MDTINQSIRGRNPNPELSRTISQSISEFSQRGKNSARICHLTSHSSAAAHRHERRLRPEILHLRSVPYSPRPPKHPRPETPPSPTSAAANAYNHFSAHEEPDLQNDILLPQKLEFDKPVTGSREAPTYNPGPLRRRDDNAPFDLYIHDRKQYWAPTLEEAQFIFNTYPTVKRISFQNPILALESPE